MAEIRRYPFLRHLRAEASSHVLHTRGGRLLHGGRGLSCFFRPLTDSLAEVPMEDREVTLLFHGRTADFQDVSAQVVITCHVADPGKLAARVDFGIDLRTGQWLRSPLDKLSGLLTQMAQQHAGVCIARSPLREVLAQGHVRILEAVREGLEGEAALGAMGLEVVSVRVSAVKPNAELEKAVEAPARERIKQEADEAAFQRRALAVEKERAIQENELQNRIELARREEALIRQQGQNAKRTAEEEAEHRRIAAEAEGARARLLARTQADAARTQAEGEGEGLRLRASAEAEALALKADAEARALRLRADAEAERVRLVEGAQARIELDRLEAQRSLPPGVLLGLAAQELGRNLKRIDHLNLSPDLLGPALANLLEAGTARLGAGGLS